MDSRLRENDIRTNPAIVMAGLTMGKGLSEIQLSVISKKVYSV